jgi:hypothetical protein
MCWATALPLRVLARFARSCRSAFRNGRPIPRSMPGPSHFWTDWGRNGGADAYLGWELSLLSEMGFGLSLEDCAVSGADRSRLRLAANRAGGFAGGRRRLVRTGCFPCRPACWGAVRNRGRSYWPGCARPVTSSPNTLRRRSGTVPCPAATATCRSARARDSGGHRHKG